MITNQQSQYWPTNAEVEDVVNEVLIPFIIFIIIKILLKISSIG